MKPATLQPNSSPRPRARAQSPWAPPPPRPAPRWYPAPPWRCGPGACGPQQVKAGRRVGFPLRAPPALPCPACLPSDLGCWQRCARPSPTPICNLASPPASSGDRRGKRVEQRGPQEAPLSSGPAAGVSVSRPGADARTVGPQERAVKQYSRGPLRNLPSQSPGSRPDSICRLLIFLALAPAALWGALLMALARAPSFFPPRRTSAKRRSPYGEETKIGRGATPKASFCGSGVRRKASAHGAGKIGK